MSTVNVGDTQKALDTSMNLLCRSSSVCPPFFRFLNAYRGHKAWWRWCVPVVVSRWWWRDALVVVEVRQTLSRLMKAL